jgi:hypothetical protein
MKQWRVFVVEFVALWACNVVISLAHFLPSSELLHIILRDLWFPVVIVPLFFISDKEFLKRAKK